MPRDEFILSLNASTSVPSVVKKINNSLFKRTQIEYMDASNDSEYKDYMVPLTADMDSGFGQSINCYELMRSMIEAGASATHIEDQGMNKKCGHMGGKILVPTQVHIDNLIAARLASDVCDVPIIIIATRTDSEKAVLLTSDIDPRDKPFLTGERSPEGHYYIKNGVDLAISRGLSYAPYCDMLWMETSEPDIEIIKKFADGIHEKYPNKFISVNLSPSFKWNAFLSDDKMKSFIEDVGKCGVSHMFVTLFGWHSLNASMFELSKEFMKEGMLGYSKFQQHEEELEKVGFKALKHQSFVGTKFYDRILGTVQQRQSSTCAFTGSTEESQFH